MKLNATFMMPEGLEKAQVIQHLIDHSFSIQTMDGDVMIVKCETEAQSIRVARKIRHLSDYKNVTPAKYFFLKWPQCLSSYEPMRTEVKPYLPREMES